jgi:hypothetical protein
MMIVEINFNRTIGGVLLLKRGAKVQLFSVHQNKSSKK